MLRTVNIEDTLHSKLRYEAFEKKVTLQSLIQNILQKYLDK